MSENKKIDPLLGGDENQKSEVPERITEDKIEQPIEKAVEQTNRDWYLERNKTIAQLKLEAVAMFPNDPVAQTKYILDGSPHTSLFVPAAEGETEGSYETVQINGYKLTIKKGVMVSVPIQVVNLIAEKYKINMTAGKDAQANRTSDVADALN